MATQGVTAVERALSIIECYRGSDGTRSLSDIASQTGLNKATIIRLIVSLEKYGYVVRKGPGEYGIGPAFMQFGAVYQGAFSLGDVTLPVLRRLMQDTQNSAALFVRQGEQRLCLFRVDSVAELRINVREGESRELLPGSSGKILLAFSDDPKERSGFDEERRDMTAVNANERNKGVSSVAAPVFDRLGELVGAITVSGPSTAFDDETLPTYRHALLTAAADLTRDLGGDDAAHRAALRS